MLILVKRLGQGFKQVYRHGPNDTRYQEFILSQWYQSALGQELIEVERALISRAISGRFGASMVQLDSGFHEILFEQRLFGSGIIVSQLENRAHCPVVCAKPEDLPFEPESLDMLLMHHTLDLCENPYQAVREGALALKPGGLLIVLGFNPLSLWGLRSMIQSRPSGYGVWNSRFIRSGRVADWMQLLNFELERQEKHLFSPPMNRPGWLKSLALGEQIQRKLLPFTGGVYLLVGYKQVFGKIHTSPQRQRRSFMDSSVTARSTIRERSQ
ncbi:MAG: SAM-dependent methyltransferase, partial [Granulosicoccus sp.]